MIDSNDRTKQEREFARGGSLRGDQQSQFFKDLINQQLQGGNAVNWGNYGNLLNLMQQQQDVFGQMGQPLKDINLPEFTNEGLSPEAMAALRSQALEGVGTSFDQQQGELKNLLMRRGIMGGAGPGGGDTSRLFSALIAAREGQKAKGLQNVVLENEKQRFLNRRDLSLPFMKISMEQQQYGNENEINRRKQLLESLGYGFKGIDSGTGIANSMQSPLGAFSSGYGNGVNAYLTGAGLNLEGAIKGRDPGFLTNFLPTVAGAALGAVTGGFAGGGGKTNNTVPTYGSRQARQGPDGVWR